MERSIKDSKSHLGRIGIRPRFEPSVVKVGLVSMMLKESLGLADVAVMYGSLLV